MTPAPGLQFYASGASDVPLLGDTIGHHLQRTVSEHAEREALVECASGRRWTYAQLDADVDRLARGLLAAGIAKGDRVGIWAPNCAEWTLTQYATAKVGAVLVNVNPAYRTQELAYALQQSGTRLLVSATRSADSDYRAMVEQVRGDCPALESVVWIGAPEWDQLTAGGDGLPADALPERMAELSADDAINIQYTSGTTGHPKGATLSHHNILNNGYFTTETITLSHEDRMCIPVPFYHCFGMVMGNLGCTSHGACMVIPAPTFEPGRTLDAVASERCTVLYGVPTMFIAQLEHPQFASYDVSSLRTGIMAGSPCPVEVMKRCMDDMHMREVSIAYGMTETSPVCRARPGPTTTSTGVPPPSAGCTRTWRSRSSTR